MKLVLVVAAALIDADGRVLLAQRPKGKALEGLWEFPGGKVDAGEAPEDALIRELMEELGITVKADCLAPLTFASHAYHDFHLLMPLYVCRRWEGFVQPRDGQALKWVRPKDLDPTRCRRRTFRCSRISRSSWAGDNRSRAGSIPPLDFLARIVSLKKPPLLSVGFPWISLDLVQSDFSMGYADFTAKKFSQPLPGLETMADELALWHAEAQGCSWASLTNF